MMYVLAPLFLFLCWLGYIFIHTVCLILRDRPDREGEIYILMGGQPEAAEWFLRRLSGCDAVLSGRMTVVLAADRSGLDDTYKITGIMSAGRGYHFIEMEEWVRIDPDKSDNAEKYDVRGMGREDLARNLLYKIKAA